MIEAEPAGWEAFVQVISGPAAWVALDVILSAHNYFMREFIRSPLDTLYDDVMANIKQVAFQIDTESLAAIDALTPSEFSSRAEVIRVAVHEWLARRREDAVDAALAKGYGIAPQSEEEDSWATRSLEGLEASNLDW